MARSGTTLTSYVAELPFFPFVSFFPPLEAQQRIVRRLCKKMMSLTYLRDN